MMFGHPSQQQHMITGVQKALASPNTPKHLRPHLEKRMKSFKGKPITAAKPQNSPQGIKQGGGGPAAQSQIAAPPMPFQNSRGPANLPAAKGPMKGVGNGASANSANIAGAKAPKHVPPSSGNPFPKKRFPPSGKSKFYGG